MYSNCTAPQVFEEVIAKLCHLRVGRQQLELAKPKSPFIDPNWGEQLGGKIEMGSEIFVRYR